MRISGVPGSQSNPPSYEVEPVKTHADGRPVRKTTVKPGVEAVLSAGRTASTRPPPTATARAALEPLGTYRSPAFTKQGAGKVEFMRVHNKGPRTGSSPKGKEYGKAGGIRIEVGNNKPRDSWSWPQMVQSAVLLQRIQESVAGYRKDGKSKVEVSHSSAHSIGGNESITNAMAAVYAQNTEYLTLERTMQAYRKEHGPDSIRLLHTMYVNPGDMLPRFMRARLRIKNHQGKWITVVDHAMDAQRGDISVAETRFLQGHFKESLSGAKKPAKKPRIASPFAYLTYDEKTGKPLLNDHDVVSSSHSGAKEKAKDKGQASNATEKKKDPKGKREAVRNDYVEHMFTDIVYRKSSGEKVWVSDHARAVQILEKKVMKVHPIERPSKKRKRGESLSESSLPSKKRSRKSPTESLKPGSKRSAPSSAGSRARKRRRKF